MRRVYLSAVTSIVARFGTIGVLLLAVPLGHATLGAERFGMWMVITSIGAVMAFADLGIGNGIVNLVASASGADDRVQMREVASSGLSVLVLLALVFVGAAVVSYPLLDWASVFRVTSPLAVKEAGPSLLIFILCFAVGLPASVGPKMQLGLQSGYLANIWMGVGSILSLIAVLTALWLHAGVPMLVLAMFGSQQLALVANSVIFFIGGNRDIVPSRHFVRLPVIRDLLRLGLGFFALQFVAVAVFRVDSLFVTQFFGPADAGIYATVERLFSLVAMVVGLYLAPLWPAYGEAVSRGDHAWAASTVVRSTCLAVGATVVMVSVLILFHPWMLRLLLSGPVSVSLTLILGFSVMKVLEAIGNALSMFLNGVGVVNVQVVFAVAMSIVASVLKLMVGDQYGIASFIWITAICYLVLSIVPLIVIVRRTLRRLSPDTGVGVPF